MGTYSFILGGSYGAATDIYEGGQFVPGPDLNPNPEYLCATQISPTMAALIGMPILSVSFSQYSFFYFCGSIIVTFASTVCK